MISPRCTPSSFHTWKAPKGQVLPLFHFMTDTRRLHRPRDKSSVPAYLSASLVDDAGGERTRCSLQRSLFSRLTLILSSLHHPHTHRTMSPWTGGTNLSRHVTELLRCGGREMKKHFHTACNTNLYTGSLTTPQSRAKPATRPQP